MGAPAAYEWDKVRKPEERVAVSVSTEAEYPLVVVLVTATETVQEGPPVIIRVSGQASRAWQVKVRLGRLGGASQGRYGRYLQTPVSEPERSNMSRECRLAGAGRSLGVGTISPALPYLRNQPLHERHNGIHAHQAPRGPALRAFALSWRHLAGFAGIGTP